MVRRTVFRRRAPGRLSGIIPRGSSPASLPIATSQPSFMICSTMSAREELCHVYR